MNGALIERALLLVFGAIAAACLTPAMCSAETATVGANEQTIMEELRAQEDPTIFTRRMWADTEWNKYKDGSHDVDETLGLLWAWRVSESQEWAVRLKVPLKSHIAGETDGDSNSSGLGEIKLGMGTGFRLSDSWRTVVGGEIRFPSGSSKLGSKDWRLQLLGAVAWDVTRSITLSPSIEYNKSIAEKDGAAPQRYLEMYFPVTFVLPHRWAVTVRYETKVDFENDDDWTHSAKFAVAKQLEQLPLGFQFAIKKPLDDVDKQFQINFVITYSFR